MNKVLKNQKGQSLVETALILPIVIFLLMGIIDFGMLFNNYLVLNNASREGARSGAVGMTDFEIVESVKTSAASLDDTKLSINIIPAEVYRKKGQNVTITLTYENNLLTPVISSIVPNPLILKSYTVMRVE